MNKVSVCGKTKETNYLVAEIIAPIRKSHTIVGKMLRQDAVREIDSTISRCIGDMSHDAERLCVIN